VLRSSVGRAQRCVGTGRSRSWVPLDFGQAGPEMFRSGPVSVLNSVWTELWSTYDKHLKMTEMNVEIS
jgi:hypothetical protein